MSAVVGWPEHEAARYRAAGYWLGETFGELLAARAAEHADRVAVVGGDARWTYRELDERAHSLAAGFADLGLRAGERVVVQLPNVPEFLEVVFALFRLGAVPVFALPAHRETELRHVIAESAAAAVVSTDAHEGFAAAETVARIAAPTVGHHVVVPLGEGELPPGAVPLDRLRAPARELPGPSAGDLAFLQLSGGTTGLPKLIPRTHDDYLYSVRASAEICRLSTDTVYLVALPAAHNFPMSSPGYLGVLHAGGRVVLCPSPEAKTALRLVERERVTFTGVVPPLAALWANAAPGAGFDLSSLEVVQVGGARCAPELARRIGPALGCRVQQVFGMAEGLVNYTRLDDPDDVVENTQGRPISADDEIRVVDAEDNDVPPGEVGALLTRGPYTIRGYYDATRPEVAAHNATAFTADGFYRTGDLVRRTPGGDLVVSGRVKDQINRGGEKVAVEEVENHLIAHPAVLDAAVVAMPDRFLGERSCAYVVPVDTAAPPTAAALRAFVRGRGVAAVTVPDRIEVVAEFPVTGVGKTSKRDLRAAVAARVREEAR
ncbi:(2,3-dihydroxybenzoyl)adenylate synthase [Actinokineospora pegani]|uniref:(2,3-dihydroxybenzoyl)adenylate synthase n=1 Tax=Actinokineospora pegani TaxID=2654637 RepID=UPI0012E9BDFF|nr:AMP-binding protein [Actinokineospora pegani]